MNYFLESAIFSTEGRETTLEKLFRGEVFDKYQKSLFVPNLILVILKIVVDI